MFDNLAAKIILIMLIPNFCSGPGLQVNTIIINFFMVSRHLQLPVFPYEKGNRWGDCGNGTQAEGCGPQETFRACSDIFVGDLP